MHSLISHAPRKRIYKCEFKSIKFIIENRVNTITVALTPNRANNTTNYHHSSNLEQYISNSIQLSTT